MLENSFIRCTYLKLLPSQKADDHNGKKQKQNKNVIKSGPRQGYTLWQNDQGSYKGSMSGKPNS